ncbi:ATP-binding protein [Rickettsia australis]|uniref:ATP-binding protein n=1 Tax=Rickettsia australis TaxID=787 RepID=UPI00030EC391|nr:ATP-binding protein [Rickettsia australis]
MRVIIRLFNLTGKLSSTCSDWASARGKGLICSSKNSSEVAWSGHDNILVAGNLIELVNPFKGSQVLTPPEATLQNEPINYHDFKDIKGPKIAKRALEIAALGGHNLLMFCSPGTGKSRLALSSQYTP